MPIRMLAESIGATVTWDNDTRSVHITTNTTTDNNSSNTNNNSSTNTNTNTNTTTSADNLTVSSIAVNTSVVNSGNAVTFTAVADSNTSVVRFSDASTGNVYEDVTEQPSLIMLILQKQHLLLLRLLVAQVVITQTQIVQALVAHLTSLTIWLS